jgi:predicted phosphodiesterase
MPSLHTRRALLRLSAGLGVTVLLPAGCRKDTEDSGTDTGSAVVPLTVSKVPWVSLQGDGTARLRFETREALPASVTILVGEDAEAPVPTVSAEELGYSWADNEDIEDMGILPDKPGTHVVQDILLTDLPQDTVVAWSVDFGDGVRHEGTFRTDPGPDKHFVLGWLADTMYPTSAQTIARLAGAGPDVVVHGGDIQYQSNPLDTWTGFFTTAASLTSQAACHFVVGNHEYEDQDEIVVMYERLMAGQGEGAARYFAFRYGGVRFICVDTETGGLDDPAGDQQQWLVAELEAASADPDIRFPVVCMHRPFFTFSKHWPETPTVRDAIHPLLVQHGVPLVLAGHAHCYERFVVDGIHYVVDGGGGALTYNPDEDLAAAEAARPEEVAMRVAVSKTYGVTRASFSGDTIALERLDVDGRVIDTATI